MKRLDANGLRKILDKHGIEYKEDSYKGGSRLRLNRCLFDDNHMNCACFIVWADGNIVYTCRHESCNHGFADAITKLEPDFYKDNSFDFRSPSRRNKEKNTTKQQDVCQNSSKEAFYGGENGKTFLFNVIGDHVIQEYHAKNYNGKLYVYQNGKYTCDKQVIGQMIREYYAGMKKAQKNEVLDYLSDYAPTVAEADPRYILFLNGIYDLKLRRLVPLTPDLFITNCIPHDYNAEANSQSARASLKAWACDDDKIVSLLSEIIGYCMYRSARFKKAFVLLGDHDSGKSTFIRILSVLLGEDNVSSLDLRELSERFNKADLCGTLCNLGDDISADYISDSALFKKITGGSRVKGEYKGIDGFNFISYCTLIFSANKMPKIEDKTGASLSRLIFVPFDANFKESSGTRNVNLSDELSAEEAIQFYIKTGVSGLERLISTGGIFTAAQKSADLKRDYEIENDSVLAFLDEYDPEEFVLDNTPMCVFDKYKEFCNRNNYTCIGERMLNKCLRTCLHYTTKQVKIRDNYGTRRTERRYVKDE